jgi:hypothetical protein
MKPAHQQIAIRGKENCGDESGGAWHGLQRCYRTEMLQNAFRDYDARFRKCRSTCRSGVAVDWTSSMRR